MSEVQALHDAACALGCASLAVRLGLDVAPRSTPERARVLCPVHDERTPSCDLTIRGGRIVWVCRSCQASGDTLTLVAVTQGLSLRSDFGRVVEAACELLGVTRERRGRATAPPALPDEIVTVAIAVESCALAWMVGRVASDRRIESADREDIVGALAVLRMLDEVRAETNELVDRMLEAMPARPWPVDDMVRACA